MGNQKIRSRKHLRKKWRRLGVSIGGLFIALLIIITGLIGLTHWSSVQINTFSLSLPAESDLPKDEMKEMVDTRIDKNLWSVIGQDNVVLLPRSAITNNIESISPRIRSAEITITGLRSFVVNVNMRKPAGLACTNVSGQDQDDQNNCQFIDKEGFVYAHADNMGTSSDLVVYTKNKLPEIGDQLIPEETFTILQSFIGNLPELGLSPQQVRLQDQRDISIAVQDAGAATTTATSSVNIRLDLSDSLNQAYTDLKTVIEKDAFVSSSTQQATSATKQNISPFALEYIDLRFGNKVFYK